MRAGAGAGAGAPPSRAPQCLRAIGDTRRPARDAFGVALPATAAGDLIECPACERRVSAARYAPHLEKCMGKGRRSAGAGAAYADARAAAQPAAGPP